MSESSFSYYYFLKPVEVERPDLDILICRSQPQMNWKAKFKEWRRKPGNIGFHPFSIIMT